MEPNIFPLRHLMGMHTVGRESIEDLAAKGKIIART